MKNRALYGRKGLDIQVRSATIPQLLPNQVLVKVHACGVCGTDLNFIRDWEEEHQPMGHEIAAEVLECGSLVNHLSAGDRVIVEDCTMCGKCKDCKGGHPELCREMYHLNGMAGMGEYLVINAAAAVPFSGIDYKYAALTEPLAVAYNAVKSAGILPGESVAILGNGPIGLLCANLCRVFGAGKIFLSSRTAKTAAAQARNELAAKIGCDEIIPVDQQDFAESVRKILPSGVDHVIATAPPESLNDGIRSIRYGGEIIFLGLSFKPGKNIIDFDVNYAIFNKISLKPSFAEPALNFPASLELIRNGTVDAALYQTHTLNFNNYADVFRDVLAGTLPVIKPVFLPHG